jgi:hypothetical protein
MAIRALLICVTDLLPLLWSVLRAEHPPWPPHTDIAAVLRQAEAHGVVPLIHAQLAGTGWPADILEELRRRSVGQAMWELRHQQVLTQTLALLSATGVEPILLKGTALAYSLYQDPALRTRGDTDMFVPIAARESTGSGLSSLGFERDLAVAGEFVSYQANYTVRSDEGSSHTIDLHWKINNSEVLSQLFTYEELRREAQPLPKLCARSLRPSHVHALLLACMHRSTHQQNPYYVNGQRYFDADRLVWLYDVHLLANRLSAAEWNEVVRLATEKGLRATCLDGMLRAQVCFHTTYPPAILAALATRGTRELPARYLQSSQLGQHWMDFCALGSVSRRLRWAHETLFPPATYMRAKYAGGLFNWLPLLYLRRLIGGVVKRMASGRLSP